MNKEIRKILADYMGQLEQIQQDIVSLQDEEQEKFDNMPEGFQQGENGQKMKNAIQELDDAVGNIADAISALENASI